MSCNSIKLKGSEVFGSTFQNRKFVFANRDISEDNFTAVVYNSFSKINEIEGIITANEVSFSYSILEKLKTGRYRIEFWAELAGIGKEMIALEEFFVSSDPVCEGNNETAVTIAFKEQIINFTIQKALFGGAVKWSDVTEKPNTFPPPISTENTLGGVKIWFGAQAEYEALEKQNDVMYFITDE